MQPLNSNQQVISNGIAQRGNTGSGPANQNVAPQQVRGGQAIVRSIPPGERLIGVTLNLFDHDRYSFFLVCPEKKETNNEETKNVSTKTFFSLNIFPDLMSFCFTFNKLRKRRAACSLRVHFVTYIKVKKWYLFLLRFLNFPSRNSKKIPEFPLKKVP